MTGGAAGAAFEGRGHRFEVVDGDGRRGGEGLVAPAAGAPAGRRAPA